MKRAPPQLMLVNRRFLPDSRTIRDGIALFSEGEHHT